MSNHGYFDEPDRDEMMMKAMDREEPEHYRTERAAREAHQIIESLSRPKKRETPPEVQQAHRIGLLEGQLEEARTRAFEEHRRAEKLEGEMLSAKANAEQYQTEYNNYRTRALAAEERAAKAEKLHKNLLNSRRYR